MVQEQVAGVRVKPMTVVVVEHGGVIRLAVEVLLAKVGQVHSQRVQQEVQGIPMRLAVETAAEVEVGVFKVVLVLQEELEVRQAVVAAEEAGVVLVIVRVQMVQMAK